MMQGVDHVKRWKEDGGPQTKERNETNPANTLILEFQPPGLQEHKFLLLKPLFCGILF